MDIWKSLDGMVEAELTSAEPGAALEAANARGIPLYDVIQVGDLTARFRVRRRDYRTLEALSEKRGRDAASVPPDGRVLDAETALGTAYASVLGWRCFWRRRFIFPPAFFSCGWRAT